MLRKPKLSPKPNKKPTNNGNIVAAKVSDAAANTAEAAKCECSAGLIEATRKKNSSDKLPTATAKTTKPLASKCARTAQLPILLNANKCAQNAKKLANKCALKCLTF